MIGDDVGAADLEHLPICVRVVEHAGEIREHVSHCDGLDTRLNPPGRRHDGQDFDQVAQHLEACAARTDNDRGPQLGQWYRSGRQHTTDLVAARQMRRQGPSRVVPQTAEIDDLFDTGTSGRVAEVLRRGSVTRPPVRLRPNRVHQVVGRIDVPKCGNERGRVEHVSRNDLHLRPPRLRIQFFRRTRQTPHVMIAGNKFRDQPPTDIARRACDEDAPATAVHSRPAR